MGLERSVCAWNEHDRMEVVMCDRVPILGSSIMNGNEYNVAYVRNNKYSGAGRVTPNLNIGGGTLAIRPYHLSLGSSHQRKSRMRVVAPTSNGDRNPGYQVIPS